MDTSPKRGWPKFFPKQGIKWTFHPSDYILFIYIFGVCSYNTGVFMDLLIYPFFLTWTHATVAARLLRKCSSAQVARFADSQTAAWAVEGKPAKTPLVLAFLWFLVWMVLPTEVQGRRTMIVSVERYRTKGIVIVYPHKKPKRFDSWEAVLSFPYENAEVLLPCISRLDWFLLTADLSLFECCIWTGCS